MGPAELPGVLEFLRAAERLKSTTRTGYTSTGQQESVAEHTWRLCLMALVLRPAFPEIDFAKLVKICIIHDLGEAVHGDVSAPEQARRAAAGALAGKAAEERRDLVELLTPLPAAVRDEITALWDEYEAAATPEARIAKGLDKLETIMQHNQGLNPHGFDYRFNLAYGRKHTADIPFIAQVREILDAETESRAREADAKSSDR